MSTQNESLPFWRTYLIKLLGAEISRLTRYVDRVIQLAPRAEDPGVLRSSIVAPSCEVVEDPEQLTPTMLDGAVVLLNGNLNYELDIDGFLLRIKEKAHRSTRVVAVLYNPYLRVVYSLANKLGLWHGATPCTFITKVDLDNIARLSGFSVTRLRSVGFFPFRWCGVGDFLNWLLPSIPFINAFGLASVVVLRPVLPERGDLTSSVIVPARNEKGNIEAVLARMPLLGSKKPEVIFVEGHSSDGTFEEIERVTALYKERFSIKVLKQTGSGKADAVRLGFKEASGELLMILDADVTTPPELLQRFYDAYRNGLGDFINGSRLVYPMEGKAMKFLNKLGNVFFAKALSSVLEIKIGDALCGTKVVSARNYKRFAQWRADFGDFDPFGDFELLFPAALFGLGIIDVPVRYRNRVYGSTNIRRFYHAWMLLKMTFVGLLRVRCGATPNWKEE